MTAQFEPGELVTVDVHAVWVFYNDPDAFDYMGGGADAAIHRGTFLVIDTTCGKRYSQVLTMLGPVWVFTKGLRRET